MAAAGVTGGRTLGATIGAATGTWLGNKVKAPKVGGVIGGVVGAWIGERVGPVVMTAGGKVVQRIGGAAQGKLPGPALLPSKEERTETHRGTQAA